MSLNRLVLRLATVNALNNFMTAPYPTLGGVHIYDSKIESIENIEEDVIFPLCIVYTDYDRGHWRHHTNNIKSRSLTITLELLVAQVKSDQAGNGFVINYPQTDSEIETALDLFETQIFAAFEADNSAAECFRYLIAKVESVTSRRGATVESGQRLAARQVTMEVDVLRDQAEGPLASEIAAFLTALEDVSDYADRVPAIRAAYARTDSRTAIENYMAVSGWSDATGEILGARRGAQVALGTPVVYINPATGTPW